MPAYAGSAARSCTSRHCPRPRRAAARAEALEDRIALSTYVVTNTNDTGAGSLRQAILDANNNNRIDDTIVFDASFYSAPHVLDVINPLPQFGSVSGGLTIVGPGSALLTVNKTGAGPAVNRRVFDSFSPRLTLSGMTLTGGNVDGNGGGLSCTSASNVLLDDMVITGNSSSNNSGGGISLANNATLTIRNSVVTGNSARLGGGIFFFDGGSLVMENCTVSGNTARSASGRNVGGGGIYFFGFVVAAPPPGFVPGTLLIENSTLSGNTAGVGGGGGFGGENLDGTLLVRNSTISGNTAATSGGGIDVTADPSTITLEDCTVTGNSSAGTVTGTNATGGGGISRRGHSPGAINVRNSIVSGNTNPLTPDILATPETTVTVRYSAVGSAAGFTPAAGSGNNLPYGADLKLGPLANNGGPTQTHAILAGSPLVNAGSNALIPAGMTTDQRGPGYPRVVGPAVDIGAFEQPAPPPGVAGRHFFYNNSSYDGNNAAANAADDGAVAPDKQALLPGHTATFANVTSFSRGINGVMIDINGLGGTPTASDFSFRMSIPLGGVGWLTAPDPTSVTRRSGAGDDGTDRVTIVWPDGAITNRWLEVTVKATANTGLAFADRSYYGNLIGETGNSATALTVNAIDLGQVRAAQLTSAPLTSRYDFNRDGRVNAVDLGLCRTNQLKSIPLLVAPGPIPPPGVAAPPSVLKRDDRAVLD